MTDKTPTDLAAALLADVPRYEQAWGGMLLDKKGPYFAVDEVLAALSRALEPALAERVGKVVEQLGMFVNPQWSTGAPAYVCTAARDLLTALMAANAALRTEVRKSAMDAVSAGCQAQEAWEAQKAAEAERDALRAERDTVLGMYMRSSDEGFRQKARAEAAEAQKERLRAERDALREAGLALCNAVEADDGSDHHHFTISGLAAAFRAALTETATTEERK